MPSILIVGWGNVGRGVANAVMKNSDTRIVGVATRDPKRVEADISKKVYKQLIPQIYEMNNAAAIENIKKKAAPDVAILCGGSKDDLPIQGPMFAKYFNTVDSFDTHAKIPDYFKNVDKVAKSSGTTALISAGWDPGTFSLERVLADAFIPHAAHYTFWGPGVSQGHSDAARQVEGVKDARSYTHPFDSAIKKVRAGGNPNLKAGQKHYREVFVVAEQNVDKAKIEAAIKKMPEYFCDYETTVNFISEDEMKKNHSSYPHGGFVMASGQTGTGNKAIVEYRCEWGSNPEATGNILVAHARAAHRFAKEKRFGAFTLLDIPPAYFSSRTQEELLAKFM